MGEIDVASARPSRGRNVVGIATIAISSGTTARNEAKTKLRTTSAPTPPSNASTTTPGPLPPPDSCWSASKPVRWTGAEGRSAPPA